MADTMTQTMPHGTVRDQIRQYLMTCFVFDERQKLADNQSLLGSGVLDSTGILELIGWLESEFGVNFSDKDLVAANFDTIERIESFLQSDIRRARRRGNGTP